MRPVSICCAQITGTACLEATYTDDSKSGTLEQDSRAVEQILGPCKIQ